nr:2-amino-4-hydroxy-6-hydroxymethyldihydropteridine diphosphokinase [Sporolactobacillus spathodeae]
MAYLGLGSNIGARASFLKQALEQLDNVPGVRVIRCSSIYETAPYGPVEQNDFLNLAVQIETIMPPLALLDTVQQIEKAMLRKREIHWGPRTIDLDILLYDQTISHTERLALPHPEIARRAFVLKPMAELAPHLVLPGINRSMIELWQTLEEKEGVRLWKTSNGAGKYGLFEN